MSFLEKYADASSLKPVACNVDAGLLNLKEKLLSIDHAFARALLCELKKRLAHVDDFWRLLKFLSPLHAAGAVPSARDMEKAIPCAISDDDWARHLEAAKLYVETRSATKCDVVAWWDEQPASPLKTVAQVFIRFPPVVLGVDSVFSAESFLLTKRRARISKEHAMQELWAHEILKESEHQMNTIVDVDDDEEQI
eukprot:PhM_4_TR18632/c0_g1_i5/m.80028